MESLLILLGAGLSFYLIYPFITVIVGTIMPKQGLRKSLRETDFGIIITAYKDIRITRSLVKSLLAQEYNNYKIYIVADQCGQESLGIEDDNLHILNPIPLNSKVRSMKFATENFQRKHEHVIVFDPDNSVSHDFLKIMNSYILNGFKAVQGKRVAGNLNSTVACLDAASEIYHNWVERFLPFKMGSSSTIAGSGMSIEADLFEAHFNFEPIRENFDGVIAGEDKLMHSFLVSEGVRIAFANEAEIKDEKISSTQQIRKQRNRWIRSYFENIKFGMGIILQGIKSLDSSKIIFGFNSIYPPLFILVLSSLFILPFALIFNLSAFLMLFASMVIFVLNFALVLLLEGADRRIWISLVSIPKFILNQIIALSQIRRSKKEFLVTEKTQVLDIEDVVLENQ